jgi:hypothetical protein
LFCDGEALTLLENEMEYGKLAKVRHKEVIYQYGIGAPVD